MRCPRWILLLAVAGSLTACALPQPVAPVAQRQPQRQAGATDAARTPRAPARPSRRVGDDRPATYTVQRGDTLFAIALDFGFDYRDLALWNDIVDPSLIRVGRQLRLTPPVREPVPETRALRPSDPVVAEAIGGPAGDRPAAPTVPPNGEKVSAPTEARIALPLLTEPQARTLRYSDQAYAQLGGKSREAAPPPASAAVAAAPARVDPAGSPAPAPVKATGSPASTEAVRDVDDRVDWIWPTRGDLVYRFGDSGKLKGIGVGGKAGQPVVAAAGGKVVYAGSGLRGYGKLVIVKHNETFLSVYAHNSLLAVKEGDSVRRGQKIAEMGDTEATRVALHFEIRRFGKPLDPLVQLPRGPDLPG